MAPKKRATKSAASPRRAALYVRQSKTREASESRADQATIGQATAERFDVDVVRELVEPPSTSGYANRGRDRREWRELLDLLRNGDVDCVIVYTTARLSRGGIPSYAELIDAAEKGGLDVDHLVLTPEGWKNELEMTMRAAMDREDSKQKARYSRELHAKLALEGRWHGGRRPFGFEADGVTHRPAEVALIVDAAERHAAGESYASIARDWMRQGIASPRGIRFTPTGVQKLLRSDRAAGYRTHHGQRTKAVWEPILSEALAAAMQDVNRSQTVRVRRHLLLGFVHCGIDGCGAPLRGDNGVRYRCALPVYGGCGRIRVSAPALEVEVFGRLAGRLRLASIDDATPGRALASTIVADEVGLLEERLAEGAGLWAAGKITAEEWLAAREIVEESLSAARGRLARVAADAEQVRRWAGRPDALRAYWQDDSTTLDDRRAVLAGFVEGIVVKPSTLPAGTPRFDPDRVVVRWKA